MRPEQRIIADWIETTRAKKGWTYAEWARRAGLGADTTITRALKDKYASVTSVPTLHQLATAAEVPSILDFLSENADEEEKAAPSEAALTGLLAALLPLAPKGQPTAQSMRVLALALQRGLELLGPDSGSHPSDEAVSVAARGAVARLRDLLQQ